MYFAVFFPASYVEHCVFLPLQITEYTFSVILKDISLRQLPKTAVFVGVYVLSSFKTVFKHKNAFSMHAPKLVEFYCLLSVCMNLSILLSHLLSLSPFFSLFVFHSFYFSLSLSYFLLSFGSLQRKKWKISMFPACRKRCCGTSRLTASGA